MKYHQEQKSKEVKAEKEESVRLKKIAASISKEIKQFWSSVEKVIMRKLFCWVLPCNKYNLGILCVLKLKNVDFVVVSVERNAFFCYCRSSSIKFKVGWKKTGRKLLTCS